MRSSLPIRLSLASAAALVAVTACTGNGPVTTTGRVHRMVPGAGRPPQSFLTVATSAARYTSDHRIARYPVETLQLRSIRHGRLIRTLLRALGGLGSLEATTAPDGSVIAAADFGCKSQLFRIDPATGRHTLIATIPESVSDIALSPDGSRLAYITDVPSARQSCQPTSQPRSPVTLNLISPLPYVPTYQVLAVVSLASGATVRTRVAHGADPTWSPDGTELAATDLWANKTYVLAAATLKVLAVHSFLPPHGCGYTAAGWSRSSLTVAVQCNIERKRSLPAFGLLPLTGSARQVMFPLPRCAAGTEVSFTGSSTLVGVALGYGDREPCGVPRPGGYAVAALVVRGGRLARVATFPQQGGVFTVAGW